MPWIRNRKTGETKWVDDPASAPARGPAEGLPGGPEPIIRAAPKVSADASPYQKGQDAISNARDASRDARDAVRDERSAGKDAFDFARDMRTEFNKLPAVTDYQMVIRQFSSALRTQPNASGDQALITAYAKMLDPGSVVREQEFNTVANADSTIGKAIARMSKEMGMDESGMLRPEIRARVRNEMLNLTGRYRRSYEQARGDYARNAQSYGVEPVRVVGSHLGDAYRDEIAQSWERTQGQAGADVRTAWQQDTTTAAPGSGGFASPGDGKKSIPIPDAMQSEFTAYVTKNRGRLDPDAYAQFRSDLDTRYGFPAAGAGQVKTYREEAQRLNDTARRGGNLNLRIPGPSADMTAKDRLNSSIFANPVGAAIMGAPLLAGGLDEVAGAARSAALGTDYAVERDQADAIRRRLAGEYPAATMTGQIAGGLIGGAGTAAAMTRYAPRLAGAAATLPGQLGIGVGAGAVNGGLENNDSRGAGAAIGAGAGAGGALLGRYVIGPAADAMMRSRAADKLTNLGIRGLNAVTGGNAALRNAPRLAREEAALASALPELDRIRTNITDAQARGLPYSLGDASPKLRALTGAVTRSSVDARELAENTYGTRALGQADRAIDAINTDLAPITNMGQRQQQWLTAAREASQPLYDQANRLGVTLTPEIEDYLRRPSGKEALRRAAKIGADEGKNPFEIGFVEDGAGGFTLPGLEKYQRGRYSGVPVGDPREGLSLRQFRGWNGKSFAHKGPIDLVTWTRQNGGLLDQNTELAHMGLTNKSRGLPFAGNDARFGPLINPNGGMTFDDAALRAWEAGYFPGPDRPSVNDYLDALRGTHEGWGRRFLPEDEAEVARFGDALSHAADVRTTRFESGKAPIYDRSTDAGPREFAPLDAWNPNVHDAPTFETLDLTKRGFDSMLQDARNPVTGRLELENDPRLQAIEGLRQGYVSAIDKVNGIYPRARGEYEKYISRRDALDRGFDAGRASIPPRDVTYALGDLNDAQLDEYQRGYATQMGDTVDRTRLSGNPWEAIYGAPQQQQKVGSIFPGAPRFHRTYELERDMTRTARETIGGSPTAGRLQADAQLMGNDGVGEDLANAGLQAATGGGVPGLATAARRVIGDKVALGFGRAAEERANRLAPRLMDTTNQQDILAYLEDVARRDAEIARRRQTARGVSGLLGGFIGASLAP